MRLIAIILLAVVAAAPAPAAPWLVKATLIDAGFGLNVNHFLGSQDPPAAVPFEVLHVAVGKLLRPRLGAALGISLARGDFLDVVDPAPISAYVFYDVSAARACFRTYTYGRLSFSHSATDGFDAVHKTGPYLTAELGISPVLWFVTPYAELSYRTYKNRIMFRLGVAVAGGPFVLGRRNVPK